MTAAAITSASSSSSAYSPCSDDPPPPVPVSIASTFTGAAMLDHAVIRLLRAALDPPLAPRLVLVADNDRHASELLSARVRHPNIGDLSTRTDAYFERLRERLAPTVERATGHSSIDVLVAGYPCQPWSNAGKRGGHDDPRDGWPHLFRAIGGLLPELVLLENVAAHGRRGALTTLGDLAELGYDAQWGTLRASDVGAPHRRDRWFCVAADPGSQRARRIARAVSRALGGSGRADPDVHPVVDDGEASRPATLPTPTVNDARGGRNATSPRSKGSTSTHHAGTTLSDVAYRLMPTPRASDGPHGGPGQTGDSLQPTIKHATDTNTLSDYAPAIERWVPLVGRPAPPFTDDRGRLSPAFVEWMMGWPDGWVTDERLGLPRTAQLKILGNGVVPQQATTAFALLLDRLHHYNMGDDATG